MPSPSRRRSLTAAPDAIVTAAIVALAWWTVLFHVALRLGWRRDLVMVLWVVGLGVAGGTLLARKSRIPASTSLRFMPVTPRPRSAVALFVVAAAGVYAVSSTGSDDAGGGWGLYWSLAVLLGLWGVGMVLRSSRRVAADQHAPVVTVGSLTLVLVIAAAAAMGSAVTQRPDADDVFLVNRSAWVAEHAGPLPQRDTIFSNEVFAVTREDSVPTAIEPLVGAIAAWTSMRAASVTYLALGPLTAALAVLALWRMLRTLGAAAPALAVAAATAFLLLDGASHASFGNFSFGRSWQGKVVFLTVIVPMIWHHALRWTRDHSRRDLILLAVTNVAAVGLTTTAVFVSPAVAMVAAAGGAIGTGAPRRLWLVAAATAPLLIAAAAMALAPAQDPRSLTAMVWAPIRLLAALQPSELWHFVFADGAVLLVAAVASATAWAVLRDRSARLAMALAPVALFGLFYAPGALDAVEELSGAGSVLWRVAWVLPVPAAVGLALTAPMTMAGGWRDRALLSACLTLVALDLMALGAPTVLDADGGTQGVHVGAPAWDVDHDALVAATRLVARTEPGGTIAAPELIGGAIAIQTTRVRAVNPRSFYTAGDQLSPGFLGDERLLVSRAMAEGIHDAEVDALTSALRSLRVTTACVASRARHSGAVRQALEAAGLAETDSDEHCGYWSAPSTDESAGELRP